MVRRRGKKWHLKISLYGVEVGAPTPARTKTEAESIGQAIKRAVRIGDARSSRSRRRGMFACVFLRIAGGILSLV